MSSSARALGNASRIAVPPPDRGLTKATVYRGGATSFHPSAVRNRSPALIAHPPAQRTPTAQSDGDLPSVAPVTEPTTTSAG